jgi:hypothetical protein
MAQVRFEVDDDFLKSLQELTGTTKNYVLGGDALSLLKWAATEIKKGRVLLTTNKDGGEPVKVVMSIFDKIKQDK